MKVYTLRRWYIQYPWSCRDRASDLMRDGRKEGMRRGYKYRMDLAKHNAQRNEQERYYLSLEWKWLKDKDDCSVWKLTGLAFVFGAP